MRYLGKCVFSWVLFCWLCCPAAAEQITAVKADRIDTVTGGVIENGVIVIRDGKISEIGGDVEIPNTARVIDAGNKTVFPGLVSPVSVVGLSAPQRGDPASHARYRVADELYPYQHEYERALQAGFTTLAVVPTGQGISGQGAIVRPVGQTRKEMLLAESGLLWIGFQANDKTKKLIKKALESAKDKKDSKDPDVAPMARAVQGEIPTFVSCTRPADTVHLLDLLKGYDKMKLVLVVGAENYHVADRLAKKKIPVVVQAAIDFERFTRNRINVPNMLAQAGVKIACAPISGDIGAHEDFRREMAELVKYGLDEETAKKAMTIRPAEALGIDYRVGSLEKGKDANLLILDGDVLGATTTIHQVMIEGKTVYENPEESTR
ncbi:MAG: amidohydrolase family protein [Planctomycetota bacterium]|jgi:imidazolonepropionase-like amidohydrolase